MANKYNKRNIVFDILIDEPDNPQALFLLQDDMLLALGADQMFPRMFADLLAGKVQVVSNWPPAGLLHALKKQQAREELASLFLNTVPVSAHSAALQAGFEPNPHDHGSPPAFLYYFEGSPRFAHLVQYPCRMAHGTELLDLLKQGISYDDKGYYTRLCLENGPSFVCEVEGEPVCWSCTHFNGTMGMIYTPEEHRRKGYARSLAAFQIDHMLGSEGFACCHVVEGNTASEAMVLGLGAKRDDMTYCWRSVLWPARLLPTALQP